MKGLETGKTPVMIDPPATSIRSVAFASLIGTTIEGYDFFLIAMALVTIVSVLVASETRDRMME
jgi:hypothetical protein